MTTRISEYVRSLPGVAKRTIERALTDGRADDGIPNLPPYLREITTTGIQSNTVLSTTKINSLLYQSARRNRDTWSAVDAVDNFVRHLSERTDSIVSGASRSIDKTKATLEGIFLSASRRETVDNMYIETFSSLSATDRTLTTAVIESGMLKLPPKTIESVSGSWSLKNTFPSSAGGAINTQSGRINLVSSIATVGSIDRQLYTTAVFTLSSPARASMVTINTGAVDVDTVRVISASGETTSIDVGTRVRTDEQVVVSFERQSIIAVEADFRQPHYTIATSNGSISTALNSLKKYARSVISRSVIGSDTKLTGLVDSGSLAEALENTTTYDNSARLGSWADRKFAIPVLKKIKDLRKILSIDRPSRAINCNYSISVTSISVYDVVRETRATWVSSPIEIIGDVQKMNLFVSQNENEDTNTRWFVSIEGRPWIPIIPENSRSVSGEILDPDFSGLASLQYPADPDADIRLRGVPSDAAITTIIENGSVVGIRTSAISSNFVLADYKASFSGIIKLDEIGLTDNDIKVIDAMTSGELGEHANVVAYKMLLKNTPYGPMDIYVDGILTVQLPSDAAFGDVGYDDETLVYCKVIGKTVIFDKNKGPATNVSVYYKYAQTSVRLKAVLESYKASEGMTPAVDAVTVGVKTISA